MTALAAIGCSDSLSELEAIIERGRQTFVEVALAIARIRDARLYRESHESFEDYCRERWGWGRNYANKLIGAGEAALNVGQGTMVPTSERQVRPLVGEPPDVQRELWNEAAADAGGVPTARHVEAAVERRSSSRGALTSSESNEWYTPGDIAAAASRVMGGIDLDPASCAEANNLIKARAFYTIRDDGLKQPWHGKVWLNPPYGKSEENESNQALWLARLFEFFWDRQVQQACTLVNAATGNAWFEPLWDHPLCFPRRRIRFVAPAAAGEKHQPTHSNVIAYLGDRVDRFVEEFAQFGRIVLPRGSHSEVAA